MFGSYIKAARERANLSVAEAAKRARLGADAIYRYERDANSPSVEMLDRLASVYGCLAGDLLPNTGAGTTAQRFDVLASAMLGLTDSEISEQILVLAAQARLNRNAISKRVEGSKLHTSVTPHIQPGKPSGERKEVQADEGTNPLNNR